MLPIQPTDPLPSCAHPSLPLETPCDGSSPPQRRLGAYQLSGLHSGTYLYPGPMTPKEEDQFLLDLAAAQKCRYRIIPPGHVAWNPKFLSKMVSEHSPSPHPPLPEPLSPHSTTLTPWQEGEDKTRRSAKSNNRFALIAVSILVSVLMAGAFLLAVVLTSVAQRILPL